MGYGTSSLAHSLACSDGHEFMAALHIISFYEDIILLATVIFVIHNGREFYDFPRALFEFPVHVVSRCKGWKAYSTE